MIGAGCTILAGRQTDHPQILSADDTALSATAMTATLNGDRIPCSIAARVGKVKTCRPYNSGSSMEATERRRGLPRECADHCAPSVSR